MKALTAWAERNPRRASVLAQIALGALLLGIGAVLVWAYLAFFIHAGNLP